MPSWLPHLRLVRPLRWVLPVLALGCGTQGATPLPEPPALAPDKISASTPLIAPASWPMLITVRGEDGAAPRDVLVRVTNLDREEAPVATTSTGTGAFSLGVVTSPGDELRLEAVVSNTVPSDSARSAPIDLVFALPPGLTPSERFSCVTVTPGLALPFAGPGSQSLVLTNACPGSITVQSATARLQLPDFTLTTALPVSIAAGGSATLSVAFSPSSAERQEDVLFLMLDDGARSLRYPITLYAR